MTGKNSLKSEARPSTPEEIELINSLSTSSLEPIHPIYATIENFLLTIEDHQSAAITALPLLWEKYQQEFNETKKLLDQYLSTTNEDGTAILSAKGAHAANEMLNAAHKMDSLQSSNTPKTILNSLFVSLFSELDCYTGNLLTQIYLAKPELFKGIKRELSLCEILALENIEAVKLDMLEKEIESIRRESYIEQFIELEKRFQISTLRKFDEWPEFIEMSQRRNLIVHNGGRVSQQYLSICKKEKTQLSSALKIGAELKIDPNYLIKATTILSKIGFTLGHTLWMKIIQKDIDIISQSIDATIFDKLKKKKWNAALHFGIFSLSDPMKKGIKETNLRIRVINTALALYNLNRKDESHKLLDNYDWTASLRDFRVGVAVIKEDYQLAAELMLAIGKKGEIIEELSYHQWPLFNKFRETPEFEKAYSEIYEKSFREELTRTLEDASKSPNLQPEQDDLSATVDLSPLAPTNGQGTGTFSSISI